MNIIKKQICDVKSPYAYLVYNRNLIPEIVDEMNTVYFK